MVQDSGRHRQSGVIRRKLGYGPPEWFLEFESLPRLVSNYRDLGNAVWAVG